MWRVALNSPGCGASARYRVIVGIIPDPRRPGHDVPWVTVGCCATACLVFAVAQTPWAWPSVTGGGPIDLGNTVHVVGLGARSTPLISDAGESWRLLTCHLVHTSWIHLVFNLAFFFAVGGAVEHVIRRLDYLALLFAVGLVSALASLIGTPQVSAGSSGLVFGVLGAAVTLGLRHRPRLGAELRPYFGLWVLPFLVIILALGIGNPMVDHANHMGGMVAGLCLGAVLRLRSQPRTSLGSLPILPWAASIATAATLVVAPYALSWNRTAREHTLDSGYRFTVPSDWADASVDTGLVSYSTAGGMVMVTASELAASITPHTAAWYAATLGIRAIPEDGFSSSPARAFALEHLEGLATQFERSREQTNMVRHVYFFATGHNRTLLLSFEVPKAWDAKYEGIRDQFIRSLQSPTLLAAADSRPPAHALREAALQ